MKIILLFPVLFFFFLINTCYSQTTANIKFREGTFYTKQAPDNGYTVRTKTHQTSYYKNNMEITWKIDWVNDSTYILSFDNSKNSDGFFKKGDKIVAIITSINGDCYSFKATFYNELNKEGEEIPPADMCLKK